MDKTINGRFLDRFTIKWRSEIGPYASYSSLTNSSPAGSNGLYIGGGEGYYPYQDFDSKFFYKLRSRIIHSRLMMLTAESPNYTSSINVHLQYQTLKLLSLWSMVDFHFECFTEDITFICVHKHAQTKELGRSSR